MNDKGGAFNTQLSAFEELKRYGVDMETDLTCPFRAATFDFEVYFDRSDLPLSALNTTYVDNRINLSVSMASNIPGFENSWPAWVTTIHVLVGCLLESDKLL